MAERTISARTYVLVCVLLVLLTVLTVAVSFLHLSETGHVAIGLLIAVCKASLWIVILVITFWLFILFALTLSDTATRGMIPFTPGH
jgi:hypothetical protein